jgi:hypothetical protein
MAAATGRSLVGGRHAELNLVHARQEIQAVLKNRKTDQFKFQFLRLNDSKLKKSNIF